MPHNQSKIFNQIKTKDHKNSTKNLKTRVTKKATSHKNIFERIVSRWVNNKLLMMKNKTESKLLL